MSIRKAWHFQTDNKLLHAWELVVECYDMAAYGIKVGLVIAGTLAYGVITGKLFRPAVKLKRDF